MKILYMDWKCFCTEDLIPAFEKNGCQVIRVPFTKELGWENKEYAEMLRTLIRAEQPDFVYSFDFYPLISNVCDTEKCLYISWVYDSPHVSLCNDAANNKCNIIFLFDEMQFQFFHDKGNNNVRFLPMASNPERIKKMPSTKDIKNRYSSEISFVGSLYSEKKHSLYERLDSANAYTKGYLEGIVKAQKLVYGENFIEKTLTNEIIDEMMRVYPMSIHRGGNETPAWLYSEYVLSRHITAEERTEALTLLAEKHKVRLYTHDESWSSGKVINCGPVDYYDQAPYVFKFSKINLNITLRSIKSGIPLRAFDIMGAGGFLMTSFTSDFLKFFIPGKDFIYYDSINDLSEKSEYYLNHDEERIKIAENGYNKICCDHTFDCRVQYILSFLKSYQ